jgi:hypothetical protein
MICFLTKGQRCLACGFSGLSIAGVVLDTADQQGDPPGLDQDLAVLLEAEPLIQGLVDVP